MVSTSPSRDERSTRGCPRPVGVNKAKRLGTLDILLTRLKQDQETGPTVHKVTHESPNCLTERFATLYPLPTLHHPIILTKYFYPKMSTPKFRTQKGRLSSTSLSHPPVTSVPVPVTPVTFMF